MIPLRTAKVLRVSVGIALALYLLLKLLIACEIIQQPGQLISLPPYMPRHFSLELTPLQVSENSDRTLYQVSQITWINTSTVQINPPTEPIVRASKYSVWLDGAWYTLDGNSASVRLRRQGTIIKEVGGSYMTNLATANDFIFWGVYNWSKSSYELWKSDGTADGTSILVDSGTVRMSLFSGKNYLLLFISSGDSEFSTWSLWRTDGTLEETTPVMDRQGTPPYSIQTEEQTFLLFSYKPYEWDKPELWISNGTGIGTVMLKEGVQISHTSKAIQFEDVIFFTADDGLHGAELWVTDGTSDGTYMVQDINPGKWGSYPANFLKGNGRLFFFTFDNNDQQQLWMLTVKQNS